MPFIATVDDQQYQVIASHAEDSTRSVRLSIRLSGKKRICCNWHNGYTFCRITYLLDVRRYDLLQDTSAEGLSPKVFGSFFMIVSKV